MAGSPSNLYKILELLGTTPRIPHMRSLIKGWILIGAVLLAEILPAAQLSVNGPHLPAPTGPFPIGRATLMCEDKSRVEPLDPNHASRRIAVDVWYPAESVETTLSPRAEYLNVKAIEGVIGAGAFRKQLGSAYEVIKAGSVTTHGVAGAPFTASLRRSPLLIFSPGGGMIRELLHGTIGGFG